MKHRVICGGGGINETTTAVFFVKYPTIIPYQVLSSTLRGALVILRKMVENIFPFMHWCTR